MSSIRGIGYMELKAKEKAQKRSYRLLITIYGLVVGLGLFAALYPFKTACGAIGGCNPRGCYFDLDCGPGCFCYKSASNPLDGICVDK